MNSPSISHLIKYGLVEDTLKHLPPAKSLADYREPQYELTILGRKFYLKLLSKFDDKL